MAIELLNLINENFVLILDIALTIIIPLLLLKIIEKIIYRIFKTFDIGSSSVHTLMQIIRDITIVFIVIGILNIFGIDIKSLFVSLGLITVAVSLAAKDTLANFVSGITVLAEKRFKVGDVIEIDGYKEHVKTISFKSVILVSNNIEIVIPNSIFSTKPLRNYTKEGSYMIDIPVTILNKYNLEKNIRQLNTILSKNKLILDDPKYDIFVEEITTIGVKLILRVWIKNAYYDDETISEVNKEIKKQMKIEDITCAINN